MSQVGAAIPLSVPSVSDCLTLDETLLRLKASPLVDGLAEFGSRTTEQIALSSDYDLLILVFDIPAPVFQMVTTIGGRLADVVLVETRTADALLSTGEPTEPRSFEGLFARKMETARILYDASGRLQRVQQLVTGTAWASAEANLLPERDLYAAWFWQSFGLLQLERLAQSQDETRLTAFDMMLTSCLPGTWRAYFAIRGLPWDGEKAALRYWATHEPGHLQVLRQCFAPRSRAERLDAYRELVERTLAPVGRAFSKGETAVILSGSKNTIADVQRTLQYWNALFGQLPERERHDD